MLKQAITALALTATTALFVACSSSPYANAKSADDNSLGLPIGSRVRNTSLETVEGKTTNLRNALAGKTTVITFYRGGWCPYCNTALADWNANLSEIESQGAQFIAITTEKPADAYRTADEGGFAFDILVDASLDTARAFDILFDVDAETQKLYKQYKIDVAKSNASGTWQLAHPGTFIVDAKGIIRYAHVSADYREGRADPKEIIAALSELD
jgi:peroxiredoxin